MSLPYNMGDAKAQNLAIPGRITAGRLAAEEGIFTTVTSSYIQQIVPGKGVMYQATAYAPTGFATQAAGTSVYLNSVAGQAAATTAPGVYTFTLPTGAQIVEMTLTNNGTTVVGGTTVSLSTSLFPTPSAVISLGASIAIASLNLTIGTRLSNVTSTLLGAAGSTSDALAAVPADTGIMLTVDDTPNTAGDLAVLLTWFL